MNRRQFIKRAAMAATAVAVAPMAVLKAEEFATGGICIGGSRAVLHPGDSILPRKIAEEYYSIKWPTGGKHWAFGTYAGAGMQELKAYFEPGTTTAWIPQELANVDATFTYEYVPRESQ